jgi:hypothetical protein
MFNFHDLSNLHDKGFTVFIVLEVLQSGRNQNKSQNVRKYYAETLFKWQLTTWTNFFYLQNPHLNFFVDV